MANEAVSLLYASLISRLPLTPSSSSRRMATGCNNGSRSCSQAGVRPRCSSRVMQVMALATLAWSSKGSCTAKTSAPWATVSRTPPSTRSSLSRCRKADPSRDQVRVSRCWSRWSSFTAACSVVMSCGYTSTWASRKSSSFSRALARSSAKFSPCAGPRLVNTPMVGRMMGRRWAISPGRLMPASNTPRLCPSRSAHTLRGTPTWLFQLPGLRAMCSSRPSRCAIHSFTTVLPLLPVMPTTGPWNCPRCQAASRCSASRVSGTRMVFSRSRSSGAGGVLTSACRTPRSTRSAR